MGCSYTHHWSNEGLYILLYVNNVDWGLLQSTHGDSPSSHVELLSTHFVFFFSGRHHFGYTACFGALRGRQGIQPTLVYHEPDTALVYNVYLWLPKPLGVCVIYSSLEAE
jgi:hypothetical protein